MSDLNLLSLSGRLVSDPQIVEAGDTTIAKFSIASTQSFKNKNGELQERVLFIDADAFGGTATFVGKYFQKGKKILVTGEVVQDKWNNKETQEPRSKICLKVKDVFFMESAPQSTEAAESDVEVPEPPKRPVAPPTRQVRPLAAPVAPTRTLANRQKSAF